MPLSVYYFLEYTAIFILLGWAIYIGYRGGQIYNGVIYTMIIGAYFYAYATTNLGLSCGLSFLGAMGLGAFAAFIPALGLAKTRAFTMAIATIGLIYILHTVIQNMAFLGGVRGMFNIPRMKHLLLITYACLFVVGFFIYRIDHSRVGRAMETSFIDPDLAVTLGLNRFWLSVFLQVFAGVIGAIAGVFNVALLRTIMYQNFGFSLLLFIFCFVFVGGYSTMWGVVVATPILWGIATFLPESVTGWRDIIYGTLLVLILIVRPEGVIDKRVIRTLNMSVCALFKRSISLNKSK